MELKEKVTNIELSKRLKELGVKQESEFYWVDICDDKVFKGEQEKPYLSYGKVGVSSTNDDEQEYILENYYISAFGVAELGEMLPKNNISTTRINDDCYYDFDEEEFVGTVAKTEANAGAKMLVYLLENKLIKL